MGETATVKFLKWIPLYEEERPFQIFMELPLEAPDQRKTNLTWDEKDVTVTDFRDNAADFQLDTHGFATRKLEGFTELENDKDINARYIPEVKRMLETELGDVGTVFVFDWRASPASLVVDLQLTISSCEAVVQASLRKR